MDREQRIALAARFKSTAKTELKIVSVSVPVCLYQRLEAVRTATKVDGRVLTLNAFLKYVLEQIT